MSTEKQRSLLKEAVAHLRDYGNKFEDDGSNEPLDVAREIEEMLEAPPAAHDDQRRHVRELEGQGRQHAGAHRVARRVSPRNGASLYPRARGQNCVNRRTERTARRQKGEQQ